MSEPTNPEVREVSGHFFEFITESRLEEMPDPHWRSVDANSVIILPPHKGEIFWVVWSPYPNLPVYLAGKNAEEDAFSMAVTITDTLITRQLRTGLSVN